MQFILICLVALAAIVVAIPHGATSYSNIHRDDLSHVKYDGEYEGSSTSYEGDRHNYNHYPDYKYEYGVDDHHSGDHKNQWEERHGDVVKGGYSFKEADGTTRIVQYIADGHNGFNARVKRIGYAEHPNVYGHEQSGEKVSGYGAFQLGGGVGGAVWGGL